MIKGELGGQLADTVGGQAGDMTGEMVGIIDHKMLWELAGRP